MTRRRVPALLPPGGPLITRRRVPALLGPLMTRRRGAALLAPGGRPAVLSGATVALGLLTVAWPLAWAPTWTYPVAGLGALAVLAAAALRWPRGPVLAVTSAVISCAVSTAGAAMLAVEGLLILAYLIAADAPRGLACPAPWLRRQAVPLVAGLIAAGAVLAMDAVHLAASAWITVAALGAAVAAYLIALPSWRRP